MGTAVSAMVRRALESFIEGKVELAQAVLEMDNVIDRMRDDAFIQLVKTMNERPEVVRQALDALLVARNLERVADHATNIAEDVIFWVQGADVRHNVHPDSGGSGVRAHLRSFRFVRERSEPKCRDDRPRPSFERSAKFLCRCPSFDASATTLHYAHQLITFAERRSPGGAVIRFVTCSSLHSSCLAAAASSAPSNPHPPPPIARPSCCPPARC